MYEVPKLNSNYLTYNTIRDWILRYSSSESVNVFNFVIDKLQIIPIFLTDFFGFFCPIWRNCETTKLPVFYVSWVEMNRYKGWFCKFLLFINWKCEISQFSLLMRNCREYYLINFNFKRVQFSCFLWNCLCSLGNANFWYTKSRNLRNHPLIISDN